MKITKNFIHVYNRGQAIGFFCQLGSKGVLIKYRVEKREGRFYDINAQPSSLKWQSLGLGLRNTQYP